MNWPHGRPIGGTFCTDDRSFLEPYGPGYNPSIDTLIAWMRACNEYRDRIASASARAFDTAFRRAMKEDNKR